MANAPVSLLEAFEELRDPRARECAYQLEELLLAAICAVISGAESWTSVAEWSQMKLDWLRQHLPFANGIASHDTFGRVFSLLDAQLVRVNYLGRSASIILAGEAREINPTFLSFSAGS